MKQFAILLAAIAMIGFASSESFAQRGGYRYGHPVHRGANFYGVNRSGFSISVGNGFNGFSYSRGVPLAPVYGGFGGYGYARPIYRGVGYGGFGPGVNINVGRGFYGGYGGGYGRPGCRGW